MNLKNLPFPFYARLAFVLIGILALGFIIILGKELLDPLMFGFLFAILLLPMSNFFERKFHFFSFVISKIIVASATYIAP